MSPAAIDLINITPIEPPTPSVSAVEDLAPDTPSFQEHLARAGRQTNDSSSRNDDSTPTNAELAQSSAAETRAPSDAKSSDDQPADAKPADPQKKTDTVAATKEKKQDDQDSNEKKDSDAKTEPIVAAIVAPAAVDATELPIDVVEITAEGAAAAAKPEIVSGAKPQADAQAVEATKAAVVTAGANVESAVDPTQAIATAKDAATTIAAPIVAEATPVAVEPTTAVVKPTRETATAAKATTQKPVPTEVKTAGTTTAATATNAAQAAVTDEATKSDSKSDEKTADPTVAGNAATKESAPGDVPAPQVAAVLDAATAAAATDAVGDKQNDKQDSRPAENRTEAVRTDRAPLPEHSRTGGGRESAGSRSTATEGSTQLSQADRVRLVERVARAVHTAEQRGGELKIRLSPPELGSLRLQIKLTDGTLSARIETETADARQVLIDNLPALRERLSDQNIRIERFDVDLFNSGHGGAPQQSREEFDQAMQAAGRRNGAARANGEEATHSDAAVAANSFGRSDGRLDITV